jgi:Tfp pilus assembly protein PilN
MSANPNDLSFLPDDYLEGKQRRRANALCGGLAVVVLGVIGATFWQTEKSMKTLQKRQAAVDVQYTEAAERIEQVNQMRSKQQQVVRRAELAATLLEKIPRSNVLAEYTNSLPPGVSLLDLTLESKERVGPVIADSKSAFEQKKAQLESKPTAAPAPKPYDVYLKVSGIAGTDVQVAQFISKMNASKLMQDVNLLISDTFEYQGQTLRRFQIEMMLNPSAEVALPAGPKTSTAAVN